VFFTWGEVFALFPSTSGDYFGSKNATSNYGFLYTAKGVAAFGAGLGALIFEATGSWSSVFYGGEVLALGAAVAALLLRSARLPQRPASAVPSFGN
jgi:OFA family oxalate/formate antiporter-like MFS transporter